MLNNPLMFRTSEGKDGLKWHVRSLTLNLVFIRSWVK